MTTPNDQPPFDFEVRHTDRNGELQILRFSAHSIAITAARISDEPCSCDADEPDHEPHNRVKWNVFGVCNPDFYQLAVGVLQRKATMVAIAQALGVNPFEIK